MGSASSIQIPAVFGALDKEKRDNLHARFNALIADGKSQEYALAEVIAEFSNPQSIKPKVCIIGGGVAGISAARILKDGDIEFEILEASNVVGGRIHQEKFAGFNIDAGAKWIQGLDGNPIWDDFKKFSRTKHKDAVTNTDDVLVFDEDGKLVDNANYSLDFLTEKSEQRKRDGKPDIAVSAAITMYGPEHKYLSENVFQALLYNGIDGEFAEGPRVTSLFQTFPLPTRTEFKDGDWFNNGNFIDIVNGMASPLDPSCIKLNHIVESVVDSHGGCVVSVKGEENKFYTHVICTVSLGVLQRGLIEFVPPLPDWKMEQLFKFDMCTFTTIFIKFNQKAWSDNEFFLYADLRRGYYPMWFNVSLDKYYGSDANMLVCIVSGEESYRVEKERKEVVAQELLQVARKMFKSKSKDDPLLIEDIFVPKWHSNPLFCGSFSNWPIDVSREAFNLITVPVNRIHFAGEHTSAKFNGYVQGAYLSGIDAAKEVISSINSPSDYIHPLMDRVKEIQERWLKRQDGRFK